MIADITCDTTGLLERWTGNLAFIRNFLEDLVGSELLWMEHG
jgi:hypothetical protein